MLKRTRRMDLLDEEIACFERNSRQNNGEAAEKGGAATEWQSEFKKRGNLKQKRGVKSAFVHVFCCCTYYKTHKNAYIVVCCLGGAFSSVSKQQRHKNKNGGAIGLINSKLWSVSPREQLVREGKQKDYGTISCGKSSVRMTALRFIGGADSEKTQTIGQEENIWLFGWKVIELFDENFGGKLESNDQWQGCFCLRIFD